jgi:hypothetical protein
VCQAISANKHANSACLQPSHPRQTLGAAVSRHDPRVGDVHILPNEMDIGLTGGQHVLDPVGFPMAQHVAFAVRGHDGFVRLTRLATAVLDDRHARQIAREAFHPWREHHRHARGIVGMILRGHCGHDGSNTDLAALGQWSA